MVAFDQGRYVVGCIEQGFAKSKNKGTPYFFIKFQPKGMIGAQGPQAPLIPCAAHTRELQFYLVGGAAEISIGKLRALGWNGQSFAELEPGGAFSFVNCELEVICTHEEYDGKWRDKWDVIGGSGSEHSSGLVGQLDALFGNQLATTGASAPRSDGRQHAAVGRDNADLPF